MDPRVPESKVIRRPEGYGWDPDLERWERLDELARRFGDTWTAHWFEEWALEVRRRGRPQRAVTEEGTVHQLQRATA